MCSVPEVKGGGVSIEYTFLSLSSSSKRLSFPSLQSAFHLSSVLESYVGTPLQLLA